MKDEYKLIFGFAFAMLLFGMGINTIIYFLNSNDCNNIEKGGYEIYSKPTFMKPTCEVMTTDNIPIKTNLLNDCPCCIMKLKEANQK